MSRVSSLGFRACSVHSGLGLRVWGVRHGGSGQGLLFFGGLKVRHGIWSLRPTDDSW